MTKFQADPEAISAAAQSFHGELDPLRKALTTAKQVNAGPAQAGTAYANYGGWYKDGLTMMLDAVLGNMITEVSWSGSNLKDTAKHYEKRDSDNAAGIHQSGKGA